MIGQGTYARVVELKGKTGLLLQARLDKHLQKLFNGSNECVTAENTHLLCKGKYHYMADLFDWFEFSSFVTLKLSTICLFG